MIGAQCTNKKQRNSKWTVCCASETVGDWELDVCVCVSGSMTDPQQNCKKRGSGGGKGEKKDDGRKRKEEREGRKKEERNQQMRVRRKIEKRKKSTQAQYTLFSISTEIRTPHIIKIQVLLM